MSEKGPAKPHTKPIDFTRQKSCSSAGREGALFWTTLAVIPRYTYPEQTPSSAAGRIVWKSFYASIHQVFGDQVAVIDRFHVVQQAVGALDGVLRSIKTQLEPEEAKELKKLRKRWLKLPNQLEVDELIARADWRRRFPELHEVIDWVQDLRKWFERKYDKPACAALWKLIEQARESALAPLQSVAGMLSRWFEPIARYIRHRYTNGMTEGFNNKIKLIQRRAFGLRNEHNRKRRILADCART